VVEVGTPTPDARLSNYADQIDPWTAGELHYIPLKGDIGGTVLTLDPR
jgi:hypothetical protein